MNKFLRSLYRTDYAKKHQVEIMYFGRASDALMMTSERPEMESASSPGCPHTRREQLQGEAFAGCA